MADELNIGEERQVCSSLRTKIFYISGGRSLDDFTQSSSTSQYWCLKTMTVVGPEGMFACPENCLSSCGCYEC